MWGRGMWGMSVRGRVDDGWIFRWVLTFRMSQSPKHRCWVFCSHEPRTYSTAFSLERRLLESKTAPGVFIDACKSSCERSLALWPSRMGKC